MFKHAFKKPSKFVLYKATAKTRKECYKTEHAGKLVTF